MRQAMKGRTVPASLVIAGTAAEAKLRQRGASCLPAQRSEMPLRLIFMGTPDFAVPTLLELAGRGHDIAAVYTRAAKPGGRRGLELVPSPVEREARRLGLAVHDAGVAERAPRRRPRSPRIGADAAVVVAYGLILPKPILDAPRARLLQPACLAAAALARRRADQPRDHGGRRRDRRHGDEDGRGPRHRRHGDGRARAASAPT